MNSSLFEDEFALAEQSESAYDQVETETKRAVAIIRKTARIQTRRAKTEAVLNEILPATLENGTSYHVISHGDVDALSYLIHLARMAPIEYLVLSTWCMAMPDVEWLRTQLHTGRIGHIQFILGEIFPAQYPDEYEAVTALHEAGLATMKIAKNHAKVMAGESADEGFYFAIESSSNVNTNPRIEQTAVHMSEELYRFYREFYDGIKPIDGARYKKAKKAGT